METKVCFLNLSSLEGMAIQNFGKEFTMSDMHAEMYDTSEEELPMLPEDPDLNEVELDALDTTEEE
jgi:hypothetical protein